MDLKIPDVAELLNVSETTIRRWISQRKIPAYKISHEYRFSKIEIEEWVMRHKLKEATPSPKEEKTSPQKNEGTKKFSLYRAINQGGVIHLAEGQTKEQVIRNTMSSLAKKLSLDAEVMTELLLDRERLMPTAVNNGISIPHARDFLLPSHKDSVTVVFPKEPIEYGALDGKPVHTLFFLFACQDIRHLELLAKIAHLSSDKKTLDFLKTKPQEDKLLSYIQTWEASLK